MRLIFLAVIAILFAASAQAAQWQVDTPTSHLRFHTAYDGSQIEGAFKRFDAIIVFDEENLAASQFSVTINLASADTENAERDETLHGNDFFNIEKFPQAKFETTAIRADGKGGYVADATLCIRDKQHAIQFPFTWLEKENAFELRATVSIDRLAFDVGIEDWADTDLIPQQVKVEVLLHLQIVEQKP